MEAAGRAPTTAALHDGPGLYGVEPLPAPSDTA